MSSLCSVFSINIGSLMPILKIWAHRCIYSCEYRHLGCLLFGGGGVYSLATGTLAAIVTSRLRRGGVIGPVCVFAPKNFENSRKIAI